MQLKQYITGPIRRFFDNIQRNQQQHNVRPADVINQWIASISSIILITAITTACGFHLRGHFAIPPQVSPLYIGGTAPYGELHQQLASLFEINNVSITRQTDEAAYQLLITDLRADRRTIAIGSGAFAAEYELIEQASFVLKNQQGELLLGPRTVTETRTLDNNLNNVISTSEEEALIRDEMKRYLAEKIARQVSAFDFPITTP